MSYYPHARTEGVTYDEFWNAALLNREAGAAPFDSAAWPVRLSRGKYRTAR